MPKHATRTSFQKGNPGKQKGTLAKFTTLKNAFINAFKRIGGEDAIYEFLTPAPVITKNKKGKIVRVLDVSPGRKLEFLKMITRMLPADVQVSGPGGKPLPQTPPAIIFIEGDRADK